MHKVVWNDNMDNTLRHLRDEGASWDEIGLKVGVSASIACLRGRHLGLNTGSQSVGKVSGRKVKAGAEPGHHTQKRAKDGTRSYGIGLAWQRILQSRAEQ